MVILTFRLYVTNKTHFSRFHVSQSQRYGNASREKSTLGLAGNNYRYSNESPVAPKTNPEVWIGVLVGLLDILHNKSLQTVDVFQWELSAMRLYRGGLQTIFGKKQECIAAPIGKVEKVYKFQNQQALIQNFKIFSKIINIKSSISSD